MILNDFEPRIPNNDFEPEPRIPDNDFEPRILDNDLEPRIANNDDKIKFENEINRCKKNLDKFNAFSGDKEMLSAIKSFNCFLEKNIKIGSIGSIIELLKSVKNAKAKKSIRVNKQSVCRRISASTSTKSLISGRYTKSVTNFLKARGLRKAARKHNLADAIKKNVQNSGKF